MSILMIFELKLYNYNNLLIIFSIFHLIQLFLKDLKIFIFFLLHKVNLFHDFKI